MVSTLAASSGLSRLAKVTPTVLPVATSSTPLATENMLAWWLAERTCLKQACGSIPLGPNRKAIGARVPEVDFVSPRPKV